MDISKDKKFGISIYLLIGALGLILLLISAFITDPNWNAIPRSLGSSFVSVALVFFLVNRYFKWGQDAQIDRLIASFEALLHQTTQAMKEVTLYPTRQASLDECAAQIEKKKWENFRINAPVGLWSADDKKVEWIAEIAGFAKNKQINTVWGIFGLPPKKRCGETVDDEEIINGLNHYYSTLKPFIDCKNVELHFYPPSDASVGFGSFILENLEKTGGLVSFGIACHLDEETVDTVFGIDKPDLFMLARQWFDTKLFHSATSGFVFHDRQPMNLRWKSIVENWYGKNYLDKLIM